ncbi:hypothetical protein Tsumi_14240 [Porphyromonas miyakawae]|uniref:Uncharacterized protein n=1 Tax=Porphyromonas miyakawae TaxID=3137470 RepID=A0ABQ0E3R4_9PORP
MSDAHLFVGAKEYICQRITIEDYQNDEKNYNLPAYRAVDTAKCRFCMGAAEKGAIH